MADSTTVVRASDATGTGTIGIAGTGTGGATTVIAVPWWQLVAARLANMYFSVVVGILTADGFGLIHLAGPGELWAHLQNALFIGLAPLVLEALKMIVTFTSNFDRKYPQLFG